MLNLLIDLDANLVEDLVHYRVLFRLVLGISEYIVECVFDYDKTRG